MARGFESKSVADQQESAQGGMSSRSEQDGDDPAAKTRRRRLELARVDIVHQLERAQAEAHKKMLQQALAALDKELAGQ
jgi:hypothetical protein